MHPQLHAVVAPRLTFSLTLGSAEFTRSYLWPRGESPVVAPQLMELIRVEGKIDEMGPTDDPVRNLCFRGLTFMHGDR